MLNRCCARLTAIFDNCAKFYPTLLPGKVRQTRVVTVTHKPCFLAGKRAETKPKRPRSAPNDKNTVEGRTGPYNIGSLCT